VEFRGIQLSKRVNRSGHSISAQEMTQYILLIQNNVTSQSTQEEWDAFYSLARQSGIFKGGSAIGKREVVGDTATAQSSDFIQGYMTFDTAEKPQILNLLQRHPVVMNGGSVELCELPKT
jgi:hypothetical protein